MATGLEVWVAKPGNACRMDDGPWTVTVFDAHKQVFEWAGMSYADLAAPNAHWAGAIPPGTYVVRATSEETGTHSEHAIVTIDCGKVACVHLFVAGPKRPDRPGPGGCEVRILEVTGVGEPVPASIEVAGSAMDCKEVKVTLACTSGQTREMVIPVPASGHWTVHFKEVQRLDCRCGGPVSVTAQCTENPACMDRFHANELRCQRERPE